jgi:hypothetical protein
VSRFARCTAVWLHYTRKIRPVNRLVLKKARAGIFGAALRAVRILLPHTAHRMPGVP